MIKPSVSIVMKDKATAGILKYRLGNSPFSEATIFPNMEEFLYTLKKGFLPDYIIYDHTSMDLSPVEFLSLVRSVHPESKVMFILSYEDEVYANNLHQYESCDFIVKSEVRDGWVKDLRENLDFIVKNICFN